LFLKFNKLCAGNIRWSLSYYWSPCFSRVQFAVTGGEILQSFFTSCTF